MSTYSTSGVDAASARRGPRSVLAIAVVALLALMGAVASPAEPASAAGNARLQASITAVDVTTGAPLTSIAWGQNNNQVGFQVDFSCLVENCTNAKVVFDPTQLDPNHNYYRLLIQSGFTPPVTGGSIAGSAAAGYTVTLGTLPTGSSGSFTVVYSLAASPGGHDQINGEYNGWAVPNFPVGFPITQRITMSADSATGPVTATSTAVPYQNTIPDPAILRGGLPTRVLTDSDVQYRLYMGSGCTTGAAASGRSHVVVPLSPLCAQDYTVTHRLPPGVELVSAEDNPTVTGSVATGLILTWRAPQTWAPTNNPEGGWLGLDGGGNGGGSSSKLITVQFPRENFAPAGQTCNYTATSGTWASNVSVEYISMPGQDGVVKTASDTGAATSVVCVDPYGRAVADPKTSSFDGSTRLPDGTSPVSVPLPGAPDNLKFWQVTVGNQANIPGVAVVTDNTLDLDGAPVYRIETTPTGASVAWTATNGTATVSGTSTSPVDAPAGYRFATAVVTSPSLAGPNQFPDTAGRTNFVVTYRYKVLPTAPVGQRRTNQASAVMTYPGYPTVADIPLTIAPHTIMFNAPFAKGLGEKASTGTLTNGEYRINIPNSGAATQVAWTVTVWNRSNVPGVAVIEEPSLRAPDNLPITAVDVAYWNGGWGTNTTGTIQYTLDNGTTGTFTGQRFTAPAGRSIVAAKVTGVPINGVNSDPTRNDQLGYQARFWYAVPVGATVDAVRTNTAKASLTFPDYPTLDTLTWDVSATARLVATPPPVQPATVFTATVVRQPLPGGATTAGTTTDVTFTVGGSTANVGADRDITPQYVFVAPAGWNITPGSASFAAGAVPAGVTFDYRTVTISGVQRNLVVASWPAGTVFGENRTLPAMTVIARPGAAVAAGTVSRPDAYIGNTAAALANDVFTTPFTDTPDLDGDGNRTERFATANNTNASTTVARVPAMQVLKEICLPDLLAADGCRWIADPGNHVGVAPNTTSITYRLTVTNTGNADLSDVVGYDVLPYPGDTGTSDPTGSVARGSTFREHISAISSVTGGVQLAYSAAEQPCRPEVDATVPGCANDWQSDPTDAQAIRLSRPGILAPGTSFSMRYTAQVLGDPSNGAVSCNSLAVRATGIGTVSEPAPVCASIEEADLRVVAGTPQLQIGRPGVLPYTVTNLGGAPSTTGWTEVVIPGGVAATSLSFGGWQCTAADAGGNPLYGTAAGPATLTCRPDTPLLLGQPRALNVPVVPSTASFTSSATVTGQVYDGDLANNRDTMAATAAAAAPGLELAKDDGVASASPGDVLTYTIDVHNPLLFETVTGATVTDTLPRGVEFVSASSGGTLSGRTVTWTIASIAPNGHALVTLAVRVLSTIDTATIANTANATAPDPANTSASLSGRATDTDQVATHPALTLTKGSAGGFYAAVGDVVTYTLSAANTGDVTLDSVTIVDPMTGLSALSYDWPGAAGLLAPGQTVTATATYTVTQADLDATRIVNAATAEGVAPDGTETSGADSRQVGGTAVPSLALDKTATGTVTAAGDEVGYSFTITNDGPLTLTGVSLSDPLPGLSDIVFGTWPGDRGVLAPGQSVTATATYPADQADIDAGRIENTAQATATTLAGVTVAQEDTATVDIKRTPSVSLQKSGVFAGGSDAAAGERVDYTFLIGNDGNTTLTGVAVADPLPGLSAIAYDWPGAEGVLLPGETMTATATYPLTQQDVDAGRVVNSATATGRAPTGDDVSADADATVTFASTASLTLDKTASGAVAAGGDEVTYTFTVRNDGSLTLSGVAVTDPMPELSSVDYEWPGEAGVLAPGESVVATATYAAAQSDVDSGRIVNSATATGRTPGGAEVSADDGVTVPIERHPAIGLTKQGSLVGGQVRAGAVIEYTLTARNQGNVTLTGVSIADPMPGLSALAYDWPGADGVLLPGQAVTATASYTVRQSDVDAGGVGNAATVTGDDPEGEPVGADAEAETPLSSRPSLALTKEASGTVARAGDPIAYTFTLTNDGTATLTRVALVDRLAGLSAIEFGAWPGEEGVLAPGQSVTATATYRVHQDDVDAGEVVNSATASAVTRGGTDVTADDTATVTIERTPALTFDKSGAYRSDGNGSAGDELLYEFVVTNTGNTTLSDVAIDDPMPGLSGLAFAWPGADGVLRPGQSATATASYTVTQADVDAREGVSNTAHATAEAPGGVALAADDTVTMETPTTSGIQLRKTGTRETDGDAQPGDTIRYRFEATNYGDVTLHDVTVSDPMTGLGALAYQWPGTSGELAPGQTVVALAEYRLTQADIDAARVVNTATVTASTAEDQDPVTDEDTATTVIPGAPGVTFDKTAALGDSRWETGGVVTFGFTIRNTGNVTLTGVAVRDGMTGLSAIAYDWPAEPWTLAPGETATATATYRLTAQDIERRSIHNAAVATSDEAGDAQDEVTLQGPAAPPATPPGAVAETDGQGAPPTATDLASTGRSSTVDPLAAVGLLALGLLLLVVRGRRRRDLVRRSR